MSANGNQEEHIKERVKKKAVVMRKVWGIGKRRFGKDWARRLWLFKVSMSGFGIWSGDVGVKGE